MLKKTCDEYYQLGLTKSGVYYIDIDGRGVFPPTRVHCNMGIQRNGVLYGESSVEHNLFNGTSVRHWKLPDMRKKITYRYTAYHISLCHGSVQLVKTNVSSKNTR